jgi:hypothetical protein
LGVPVGHRRFRIAAVLLVVGAVVGLCFRVLFFGEAFCQGDLAGYYRPAKSLIASLARASGGVPVWNPFFASGQPFAGNPEHEIFHPLTTLFFLLPFEAAFSLQVMAPLVLGTVGMFVLLRSLRRSRWASLMGAVSWGFGGYLLSTTMLLPSLFAASILPLGLAFAVRLVHGRSVRESVGLALCVGWQCLAGEPSILLAMALPFAALLVLERRYLSRRGLLRVAAGLALGAAIGGAALIPGIDHASKTVRSSGLSAEWASLWSMPPLRVLDLLSPNALGHFDLPNAYWGLSWYAPRPGPFLPSLYPGLLVTALAVAACVSRFRRLLPLVVLGGVGFLLALGKFFPLWPLVRRLPLLSTVRFPEKFALLLILPLVIVAAHGFDCVVRGPERSRRVLTTVLAVLAGTMVLVAATLWLARGEVAHAGLMAGDALRVAALAVCLAALFALRRRLGTAVLAPALVLVLALDLVTAGRSMVTTRERSDLNAPPAFLRAVAASGRDETVFHWAAWIPGLNGQLGTNGVARPPIPAQWGLALTLEQDFDLTQLRWTWEATDRFWGVANQRPVMMEPLLRRRGVTTVVQAGGTGQGPTGTAYLGAEAIPIRTAALADSRPLVFAAGQVEIVDGNDGWEGAVLRLGGAVVDTACVDRPSLPAFPGPPSPAEVEPLVRTPDRMAFGVRAHGPNPSFLAINQTWDPFWRASIDGQPVQLVRTDIALSGLVVAPGQHSIVLEYSNPWLQVGMATSACALLGCLILLLLARRARPSDTITPRFA